jgi:hypothetical protein
MQDIPPHTGEHGELDPGEHSPEGRWLTYGELGRIRGIGRESAVKLAQRKRWRRIPGNDGVARVFVPPDWLAPAAPLPAKPPPKPSPEHSPEDSPLLAGALAALEDAVAEMRQRAEAAEHRTAEAERRADAALALADQSVAMLTDAAARADRGEAAIDGERKRADRAEYRADGLRGRIDELEVNLAAARAEAHKATEAAAALTREEEARKARGRLRRAWDGWRGR